MDYRLGYGKKEVKVEINDNNLLEIMNCNKVNIPLMGEAEIIRALENPINSNKLRDVVKEGEKVAIITSDKTRPIPSKLILPHIIKELIIGGIKKEDITIVFALGSHKKHNKSEMISLVGENIYNEVKCVDSDALDCINVGTTKRGTPVDITRIVASADRRICLGNIEMHYFAGYSGGAKAIMPGVSSKSAIQENHKRMINELACAGNLINNPVREDIDEVGEYISIDFIFNVILNENKEIIKAVAGNYIDAHREGCKFLDRLYKIKIDKKADIVITSAGGFPKDINLYQAQKALDNAKYAVKDGGIIILVAACSEGLGEKKFEEWLMNSEKPSDLTDRVKDKFELGGHKAVAIALVLKNVKIYLVSDFCDKFVEKIFLKPFENVQRAYDEAIKEMGEDAKVILIPMGGVVLPFIK